MWGNSKFVSHIVRGVAVMASPQINNGDFISFYSAVPIERAARIMKLNEEATRDLVRVGCLSTIMEFSKGRDRRLVPLSSVNQFKRSFISASEIAVRMKTSPRNSVIKLAEAAVSAATGPLVDEDR